MKTPFPVKRAQLVLFTW